MKPSKILNLNFRLKAYMKKKETNHLVINHTQQKYAKSFQKVPWSYSSDGYLRFGDSIMLMNKCTNGTLVFDMSDRITAHDEAYSVTSTDKDLGPCARSVLTLKRYDEKDGSPDDVVRYGQQIQLPANPYISGKPLYLHSTQVSP